MRSQITETHDSPNSIEVDQNAKGQYTFHVKIYCDDLAEIKSIDRIKRIYAKLHKEFPNADTT